MKKSISLHPKLVAVVYGVINLAMLWWLTKVSAWWQVGLWVLVLFLIGGLLMYLMYYPPEFSKWRHLLSLFFFSVGSICFLLFIESQRAWFMIAGVFVFFNFFSFWLVPASNVPISPFMKPNTRWRFIMSVLGLAGIFVGMEAVIAFQLIYVPTNWVWIITVAIIATFIAGWWWNEYGYVIDRKFWMRILLWFVVMVELLWVIQMLPLGYLVSGLVLIWIWYILWLLIRFSMSSEGVDWKKQAWFLGINSVLFICFLIFAAKWR
jgi:hypothetical protein